MRRRIRVIIASVILIYILCSEISASMTCNVELQQVIVEPRSELNGRVFLPFPLAAATLLAIGRIHIQVIAEAPAWWHQGETPR